MSKNNNSKLKQWVSFFPYPKDIKINFQYYYDKIDNLSPMKLTLVNRFYMMNNEMYKVSYILEEDDLYHLNDGAKFHYKQMLRQTKRFLKDSIEKILINKSPLVSVIRIENKAYIICGEHVPNSQQLCDTYVRVCALADSGIFEETKTYS